MVGRREIHCRAALERRAAGKDLHLALVGKLAESAASQDLKASLDALHSLVGMSGEVGASALHLYTRHIYQAMVEGHCWPAEEGWLPRIQDLAARTDEVLREYRISSGQAG